MQLDYFNMKVPSSAPSFLSDYLNKTSDDLYVEEKSPPGFYKNNIST